ncbi:MAG: response regulator [Chloroflexi bacterium]|nr:MAG: response regulator [Chloroflexota bacterium]TMG03559.1 MAG: response regulator [Chloroflexota bacterium]
MRMSLADNGNLATCLVIDDEPAILRLVAVVLEDLGCEALTARDAESGLEVIEKLDPDFVISDVKLPGMDGLELARRIKSEQKQKPVLLMSAFGEPRNHAGDGFLAKPFDIDGLVDFVSPYLDSQE